MAKARKTRISDVLVPPKFRLENWEQRLVSVIEDASFRTFDYAKGHNCFFFAMDCVEAVTGIDPYEVERSLIKSEEDVLRRLRVRGFRDIEGAIESIFESVPPSLAHRGDLGIVELDGLKILVVFINLGVVGLTLKGTKYLPVSMVLRAYKVGRT